jgi:peptidoglycan hydrolase CwlO-like protein
MTPKFVPVEEVVVETVSGLLVPLQSLLPGSAEKAMKALSGGRRVEQAGQALMEAIEEQIKSARAIEAEKQVVTQRSIGELEQKVRDCQREIKLKQEESEKLSKVISEHERMIHDLRTTISAQNRLLAEQHEQIVNLYGVQGDDACA